MVKSARDPVVAGLAGGLAVGAIESVVLYLDGAPVSATAVVVGLLIALGVACGGVLAAVIGVTLRFRLMGWPRVLVCTAPVLLPATWLAASLFEGAYAATLPGAGSAWLWLPGLAWVAAAAATWLALRARGKATKLLWRVVVPAGIAVGAELGNRLLFESGYAEVHAVLIPVATIGLSVAWLGLWGLSFGAPRVVLSVLATTVVLVVLCLGLGLRADEDRIAVATAGNHARHLVNVVRSLGDRDGDGYSRWLGGGDCDDGASDINPGVVDVPGNGTDEDCDGNDATTSITAGEVVGRRQAYLEWKKRPDVLELTRRTRDFNVLVISVDALRADTAFIGPELQALRDRSVAFTSALSPGAGTDLSLSSFVTGRIDPFVELQTTVLEAIQDDGRSTLGILPREVLRYAGKTLLTRGLDRHKVIINDKEKRDVGGATTSVETTDAALAGLKKFGQEDGGFFLWVHYFDIHEHLQVKRDDPGLVSVGGGAGQKEDTYRALVRLTDREIGRLLDGLEELGFTDRTIVVLFSDHGESLGEDSRLPDNHGLYVYQPLVAVPILIAVPGVEPEQVAEPVTLVDLSATLLELVGARRPKSVDGVDLRVFFTAGVPKVLSSRGAPVVLNESKQWGVVDWPDKLMVRPDENLVELYDLGTDPHEKKNLAAERPEVVARLKKFYLSQPRPNLDRTRKARRERERIAQPPESRRR